MGFDFGTVKVVLFGGSLFTLLVSMLAGCIMYSCYVDKEHVKTKVNPMSMYNYKYKDVALSASILSAIAAAVICVTIVLFILGLADMIILILSIITIVVSFAALLCNGLFYDFYLYQFSYEQKLYNKTKHVEWAEDLTKNLWKEVVDIEKQCSTEVPNWDSQEQKMKDGKNLFIEIWGNSVTIEDHEPPAIEFKLTGNKINYKLSGGLSSCRDSGLATEGYYPIATTQLTDKEKVEFSKKFYYPKSITLGETFKDIKMKFSSTKIDLSIEPNETFCPSTSFSKLKVFVTKEKYFPATEVDDYSITIPTHVVLLSSPEEVKYSMDGFDKEGIHKINEKLIKDAISKDYICYSEPKSQEDISKCHQANYAGEDFDVEGYNFYDLYTYLSGQQVLDLYNLRNVGTYPAKYRKKYADENYRPKVYSYGSLNFEDLIGTEYFAGLSENVADAIEELQSLDFKFELAHFGITNCIIASAAVGLFIIQIVLGFVFGSSSVSGSP